MLDSYLEQEMFSDPMTKPMGANTHHMLWRYTIKMYGTRKACIVCDGSSRQGTITLRHTYANSLVAAASERLFWSITAQKGLMAYGADCSNAFAEAPPPKVPLYMLIDKATVQLYKSIMLFKDILSPQDYGRNSYTAYFAT